MTGKRISWGLWLFSAVFLITSCTAPAQEASPTPAAVITADPIERPTATLEPVVEVPPAPTALPTAAEMPITPSPTILPPAPTATAVPLPLTFAVIGDYGGTTQGTIDVAALVDRWEPDLVLTVGDNNYPDGAANTIEGNIVQHYGRYIKEGRFFPALGNHDMTTDDGRPYLDFFELPGNERYYDFVRGDIHFFVLNSDWREIDGIRADSRQAAWLQEGLAASTTPWQVVTLHVPPYVSMAGKEVPVLRWPFADWGADLVLSGHAHLYERLEVEGLTYVVNGLGGTVIYPFDDEIREESQARFNEDFGALLVEGTADYLKLQFVTRGGVVVDAFTVE